jgi:tRNA 2-selenouridine synthase
VILTIDDFLKFRHEFPVADVRSEGEFAQGHIHGAVNIPILNNSERIAVGTDYKQKGQLEAIKTGFRLVGPRILEIVNDAEQLADGKELVVHCWRGGMRSSNFCQFVGMARIKTHQVSGGYKAYRAAAIKSFGLPFNFNIISGFTGSGKTEILRALSRKGEQVLDLEHLARHKGSAFGGLMMEPQPTTEQFQNDLFEAIQNLDLGKRIWVEDESITIGKIVLPELFWKRMGESPVVEIQVSKEVRVERLVGEYGHADREAFLKAMSQIVKRLGGQHYLAAKQKLQEGDMASTIDILLTYYDKAYQMGISKKENIKLKTAWNGKNADDFAAELIRNSE